MCKGGSTARWVQLTRPHPTNQHALQLFRSGDGGAAIRAGPAGAGGRHRFRGAGLRAGCGWAHHQAAPAAQRGPQGGGRLGGSSGRRGGSRRGRRRRRLGQQALQAGGQQQRGDGLQHWACKRRGRGGVLLNAGEGRQAGGGSGLERQLVAWGCSSPIAALPRSHLSIPIRGAGCGTGRRGRHGD